MSNEQSQALERMIQVRTCPSISVLAQGGEQVEKHLALCSSCRTNLKNKHLFEAAGKLLIKKYKSKNEASTPKVGDIRRISPDNSNPSEWFDINGRYYNPPLVLVLSEPDYENKVRVAQVFEDEVSLVDVGDINVKLFDIYAEAWNIYRISINSLAQKPYTTVNLGYVDAVLEAAKNAFPAYISTSPLYQFRSLEISVGTFFIINSLEVYYGRSLQ